jgi:hypothetical protein
MEVGKNNGGISAEGNDLDWRVIDDCLTKPDEAYQALEILRPEMFEDQDARNIFNAIKSIHESGDPAEWATVFDWLDSRQMITQNVVTCMHSARDTPRLATPIEFYANKLAERFKKRVAREILQEHSAQLRNGAQLNETIQNLDAKLASLRFNRKRKESPELEPFSHFPVEKLPGVLADFVQAVSASVGCDPVFVVLPMLATLASAIGNTRRLSIKRGWTAPPILWCAVIGESGTQKSPAMRAALKPIERRQQEQMALFHAQLAEYKSAIRSYRQALRKSASDDLEEPEKPLCIRTIVKDATIESLVPILADNWRGVLLARDELAGWFGGFDRYSGRGAASADAAHWLSIYNAESVHVDRKTGDVPSLYVPHPAVCICGSIQPGILRRALSAEHRENGLAARLLMACPPTRPKKWRDETVSQVIEDRYEDVLDGLYLLQPDTGADGKKKSGVIQLSPDARRVFVDFDNDHGEEHAELTGELAAASAKLEEIPARLALVIHCVRQVAGESVDPWECDEDTMSAAVAITHWFKRETRRVYCMLKETPEDQQKRQLAEWIRQRGGVVRSRDVLNGRRDVTSSRDAELSLQALVKDGYGTWRAVPPSPRGGAATREFVLAESCLQSAQPT